MTLILETSSDQGALEALKEKYENEPYSKLFMPLAEQLRTRGRYGEAIELCTRAKALHPRYVSCRVLLGRCFMELGMKEEACRELEEVLEMDRENVFSLRVMAETHRAQGSLMDAADCYRALVRINPADMDAQERLAVLVTLIESSDEDELKSLESFEDTNFSCPDEARAERVELDASALGAAWEAFSESEDRHRQPRRADEGESQPVTLGQLSHCESADSPAHQAEPAASGSNLDSSSTVPPGKTRSSRRSALPFFKYEIKQSDFSMFAKWVGMVRQESDGARENDSEQQSYGERE